MQPLWILALCMATLSLSQDCSRHVMGHFVHMFRTVATGPTSQQGIPAWQEVAICVWQFHVQGDDSPERPLGGPRLRRTNSFSDWESLHNVWTAAEVIKAAGYPLEQHTVTTSDGYILRMERLPRHGTVLLALQMPNHTCCTAFNYISGCFATPCCIDSHQ